jgi:hypothetical protein
LDRRLVTRLAVSPDPDAQGTATILVVEEVNDLVEWMFRTSQRRLDLASPLTREHHVVRVTVSVGGLTMDPVTIAAGAVALLSPFLARATGEFAGAAGEAAWRLAERVLSRFRDASAGNPSASESLDEFANDPEGAGRAMAGTLISLLEGDPKLAEEVASLLEEVKRLGPTVAVTQKIKHAEDVVGLKATRLNRGEVDVVQVMDKATKVVGVELGEIG